MRFAAQHQRYRFCSGSILDHGEIAGCEAREISAIEARWLCARLRHMGIEQADGPSAEYCRARMLELHDALGQAMRRAA